MKIVSFKIAKAIKEAGYPQGRENTAWYNEDGVLVKPFVYNGGYEIADAPNYFEVWLWLWIKKNFYVKLQPIGVNFHWQLLDYQYDEWHSYGIVSATGYQDQEEAIIAAIDYLVDNNLIK